MRPRCGTNLGQDDEFATGRALLRTDEHPGPAGERQVQRPLAGGAILVVPFVQALAPAPGPRSCKQNTRAHLIAPLPSRPRPRSPLTPPPHLLKLSSWERHQRPILFVICIAMDLQLPRQDASTPLPAASSTRPLAPPPAPSSPPSLCQV